MALSGRIDFTQDRVLTTPELLTNAKVNEATTFTARVAEDSITARELADDVLEFTGLVYWEEVGTTFQPKAAGYALGASGAEVGNIISNGYIQLDEIAAPSTPGTGTGRIYPKTDGLLYFLNDAGTEYDLTSALTYWEEDTTTFQPKSAGYDLGATAKRVGDMYSEGFLELGEQATPSTPASGFGRIYPKTDGLLYFLNDGGTEYDLTWSLSNWEEDGTTFQPTTTGYNIGASSNRVGDITYGGSLTLNNGTYDLAVLEPGGTGSYGGELKLYDSRDGDRYLLCYAPSSGYAKLQMYKDLVAHLILDTQYGFTCNRLDTAFNKNTTTDGGAQDTDILGYDNAAAKLGWVQIGGAYGGYWEFNKPLNVYYYLSVLNIDPVNVPTPPSNHLSLYHSNADGNLYYKDSSGSSVQVSNPTVYGGADSGSTLGAAATTFAVTSNFAVITGDGGGNTISTITGGVEGQVLTLLFTDSNVTITDTDAHTADTVDLSAAFTSADDTTLTLIYDGTSWYEISRSVN